MASNKTGLPVCDLKIFEHGEYIAILDAEAMVAEEWVRTVAGKAKAQIDWHYLSKRPHVLHLGDAESHRRVCLTIDRLPSKLKRKIFELLC